MGYALFVKDLAGFARAGATYHEIGREPIPCMRISRYAGAMDMTVELGAADRRARLVALRAELAERGFDGFLVPLADEHQGEFIAPRAQRLAWLTGFTGSAGLAIVLADRAALFIDGRYTLQARQQVDVSLFEPLHITETPPADWLAEQVGEGARIGFDPWLHTLDSVDRFQDACRRAGARLAAVSRNPVDAIWDDQPPPPAAPVVPHPDRFAGRASAEKRAEIAAKLRARRIEAAFLSAPDSIAWLLNLRGGDVANTPIALCFALIRATGAVTLFIGPGKVTAELTEALGPEVTEVAPDQLGFALDALGAGGQRVQLDPATAPAWAFQRLADAGAEIVRGADPCALPKACKNDVELAGSRAAHLRDGAALTRFLAWLADAGPAGDETELSAAAKLASFREEGAHYRGPSFDTISGAGPNGAIVHYRVDAASNRAIEPGLVYLVDSGAQYLDGTTDVTRTVWIGGADAPDQSIRDRFTRVLKGHIALATARFPAGTNGSQLDVLARLPLWQVGLDFDHGTGHGVGSYLGVHEGPARISKLPANVPLRPGMILSDEPGYYLAGAYGIRIENLLAVHAAPAPNGAEREMLTFETLTLAPIDRALIDPALLTPAERDWLNAYHARVRGALTDLVDAKTRDWLAAATAEI